jgi:hypothetical protein
MNAYRKSRGITLLILNLSATWKGVVTIMPWLLYAQERCQYPMHRRLCVPQNWSDNLGKRKISPSRDSNPRSSSAQPSNYTDYAITAPHETLHDYYK